MSNGTDAQGQQPAQDTQLSPGCPSGAKTESKPEPTKRTFIEAPFSANVRVHIKGRDWQLTVRTESGEDLVKKVNGLNTWLDSVADKGNGNTIQPAPSAPVPPPPIAQSIMPAQPSEAVCQMIEVGLSFRGNKPQLKFHCVGLDKPLTYTKSQADMVNLLAPLGFTAAHLVNGQKYATSAVVSYAPTNVDGKIYNNITAVRKA